MNVLMKAYSAIRLLSAARAGRWVRVAAVGLAVAGVREGVAATDLFIGTAGRGHVSPAAAYPFGALQAGPDTSAKPDAYVGDWPHTCGYQHGDPYVWRFSQNRFFGTGCGSMGLVGLLPSVTPFAADERTWRRTKVASSERAEPGYYAVTLAEGNLACEMTVRAHTAAYRFRVPAGERLCLIVDADWGVQDLLSPEAVAGRYGPGQVDMSCFGRTVLDGAVQLVGPQEARVHCHQIAWNEIDFHAVAAFSHPVLATRRLRDSGRGRGEVWEFDFGVPEDGCLEIRLALSIDSVRAAASNLATEMPRFDFDGARAASAAAWAKALGVVELAEGGDADTRASFLAALYRTFIHPSDLGDIGSRRYSNISCWDIFRAEYPWLTLVAPEKAAEIAVSMCDTFDRQGYLPILHSGGGETHCMIGHHGVPMVVDAALKFPDRVDRRRAYAAVRDSLRELHVKCGDGTWGLLKEEWPTYDRYGYYPFDRLAESYHGAVVKGESCSRTLECAYDDACAARLAAALGLEDDAAFFTRRGGYWKNVFDASVGFARGRDAAGKWREPFDPKCCGAGPWAENDFTEGNAWQYTWHVMQDVPGLRAAFGGARPFGEKLQALFEESEEVYGTSFTHDVSGLIGQYAHGNEPSHHVAYLFRFSDRPRLTDLYVRRICREMYRPSPDGLCGNDDAGQMAAWFVFSCLGFYPVDPTSGEYVLGSPQFPRVTLHLADERGNPTTFTIVANNLSAENGVVKSVTLNGRPVTDWKIRHADLVRGGELVFEMGPDATTASAPSAASRTPEGKEGS